MIRWTVAVTDLDKLEEVPLDRRGTTSEVGAEVSIRG